MDSRPSRSFSSASAAAKSSHRHRFHRDVVASNAVTAVVPFGIAVAVIPVIILAAVGILGR